ncbi:2-oxo-tetronate isomerase [Hydrogenophaga atypica]|uniref:2-oxo-tetronate isomerase n=1 Tax=Hydrogenophaga atypica TaxID=249409 RepID=A0ABW2QMV7_9BURK
MPRFAANLSMMYTEVPFLDRFAAAAQDGFEAVEYLFPYEHTPAEIAQRLQAHGLTQALFNLPPGDWAAGERGMACLPGREAEFAASVDTAIAYAQATGCKKLHAMAGLMPAGADTQAMRATYVANLRWAAAKLAPLGITLLIEPINSRDMPGYFLNWQQQAHDVLAEVGAPNLKVQMDFYHCQIMEGDLTRRLEKHWAGVGHIQIAGVPERHEPDSGEVNFPHLFDHLDQLGYGGFIGCEYRPKAGTSAGLGWLRAYLASKKTSQKDRT